MPFLPAAALTCRTGQLPGGPTRRWTSWRRIWAGPAGCVTVTEQTAGRGRASISSSCQARCGQTAATGQRVGTHALTAASQATLWGRLRQHRGHISGRHPGGGNHRASVFRRHVGAAIIRRRKLPPGLLDSWLDRHGPRTGHADQETRIEEATSTYIGAMPFLWLAIEQRADRGCVERNSIALTSCLADGLDQPSAGWLGHEAARAEISQSGLWNIEHIRHHHEPGFLDLLDQLIHHQR